jgi:hypothetical protein
MNLKVPSIKSVDRLRTKKVIAKLDGMEKDTKNEVRKYKKQCTAYNCEKSKQCCSDKRRIFPNCTYAMIHREDNSQANILCSSITIDAMRTMIVFHLRVSTYSRSNKKE